jgi:hypothetical protein
MQTPELLSEIEERSSGYRQKSCGRSADGSPSMTRSSGTPSSRGMFAEGRLDALAEEADLSEYNAGRLSGFVLGVSEKNAGAFQPRLLGGEWSVCQ